MARESFEDFCEQEGIGESKEDFRDFIVNELNEDVDLERTNDEWFALYDQFSDEDGDELDEEDDDLI